MAKRKSKSKFGLIMGVVALVACVLVVVGVIIPIYTITTTTLTLVKTTNIGGFDFVNAMFSHTNEAYLQAVKAENTGLVKAISYFTNEETSSLATILSIGVLGTLIAAVVSAASIALKLLLKGKLFGKIAKFSAIGCLLFAILTIVMVFVLSGKDTLDIVLATISSTAGIGAYLCVVGGLGATASTFLAKY